MRARFESWIQRPHADLGVDERFAAVCVERYLLHSLILSGGAGLLLLVIDDSWLVLVVCGSHALAGIALWKSRQGQRAQARTWTVLFVGVATGALVISAPQSGVEVLLLVNLPALYLWYPRTEHQARRRSFGVLITVYIVTLLYSQFPAIPALDIETQIVLWWVVRIIAPLDLMECAGTLLTSRDRQAEALADARDAAEAASRLKSRILNSFAHNLRTPLAAAIGLLGELRNGDLEPAADDVARDTERQVGRVLRRITDVLDLAHLETNDAADPVPGLGRAIPAQAVHRAIGRASVDVRFDVGPQCDRVHCFNVSAVERVTEHLVENAARFGAAPVCVTVRIEPTMLVVAVQDAGPGIPARIQNRIFTAFEVAGEGPDNAEVGQGVGLALCRALARNSGGELRLANGGSPDIESKASSPKPILGAHFVLEVPIAAATSFFFPQTIDLTGLRVLYAEDEVINRKVVGRLLERLGCEVEFAEDGVEAVERVSRTRYDFVLMDVRMPRMDGLAATRIIKTTAGAPPIIALTANSLVGDRQRCMDAGMDGFLSKPLSRASLLDVLGTLAPLLGRRTSCWRSDFPAPPEPPAPPEAPADATAPPPPDVQAEGTSSPQAGVSLRTGPGPTRTERR